MQCDMHRSVFVIAQCHIFSRRLANLGHRAFRVVLPMIDEILVVPSQPSGCRLHAFAAHPLELQQGT